MITYYLSVTVYDNRHLIEQSKMSDHFTSSDEDLEDLLRVMPNVPKAKLYFEETVLEFSDEQYKTHFRLSRESTQDLATRFEASEYYNYQQGEVEKVTPLKYITVFIWFAANEAASFRDVADRFSMSKSTLHKIVRRVTYFLSNLSPEIIKWPTDEELNEIEAAFRTRNLPGVVGVIDGTHIRIDKPAEDPDSYLNRKHFYSIQTQIVCDHKRQIRDIFVGYPGSVHDSRVFRASPLYETLPVKCANNFIIADSAYPCLRHLLTPFRDRGQLTRRQVNYNFILSKNRYVIEHCFGLLKQRFRQLYHIKLRKIEDVVHFIRACAVLHNLCVNEDVEVVENQPEPENPVAVVGGNGDDHDDRGGIARRNEVMAVLQIQI